MAGSSLTSLAARLAMTDEQAMWRGKMQDDPEAFAPLVARWEKPVQRLGLRLTADFHRGEDVAQETFARLFARRKAYEPSGRFSTFLWRLALNLCYDELRKIKRRGELPLEEEHHDSGDTRFLAPEPAPDARLVEQERGEAVRRALLELSEPYRVVVVLRHYEGLKFREIGELLDLPEGTVKSRMAEALNQLNRILNPVLADDAGPAGRINESLML